MAGFKVINIGDRTGARRKPRSITPKRHSEGRMTRSPEDDARRRLEAADLALTEDAEDGSPQQGSEKESWEGPEEGSWEGAEEEEEPPEPELDAAQADGWLRSRELRRAVRQLEQELARRRVRLAFLTSL